MRTDRMPAASAFAASRMRWLLRKLTVSPVDDDAVARGESWGKSVGNRSRLPARAAPAVDGLPGIADGRHRVPTAVQERNTRWDSPASWYSSSRPR